MKILITFLLYSLSICALYSQNDSILFEKSIENYNSGKHKKAYSLINQAIEKNSSAADYYIMKGKILYELNEDLGEFFSLLTKAVNTEPTSPKPLITRAYYYEQITKFPEAILDYNDALKLAKHDSTFVQIYINRGGLYSKIQKPQLGYEDLIKAYKMDSTNLGVLNNLAICLDELGKKNESFDVLKKVVEIDPLFVPGWVNLGFQASLREKYSEALTYLNKADSLEPNVAFTLNNRGYVKLKLKDIKGALNDINKSIELDKTNSYAYRNRALVYLEKKELNIACENLYLAKRKGFSLYFGEEVNNLIKNNCLK